jgi:pyruvate,water dikinase
MADGESWSESTCHLAEHLNRFGHAVCVLDFAASFPAEDPGPVIEAHRCLVSGQGHNPHERQSAAAEARELAAETAPAIVRVGSPLGAPLREEAPPV